MCAVRSLGPYRKGTNRRFQYYERRLAAMVKKVVLPDCVDDPRIPHRGGVERPLVSLFPDHKKLT